MFAIVTRQVCLKLGADLYQPVDGLAVKTAN